MPEDEKTADRSPEEKDDKNRNHNFFHYARPPVCCFLFSVYILAQGLSQNNHTGGLSLSVFYFFSALYFSMAIFRMSMARAMSGALMV